MLYNLEKIIISAVSTQKCIIITTFSVYFSTPKNLKEGSLLAVSDAYYSIFF